MKQDLRKMLNGKKKKAGETHPAKENSKLKKRLIQLSEINDNEG